MQQIDPAIDEAIRQGQTGFEKLHLFVRNYVPVMMTSDGELKPAEIAEMQWALFAPGLAGPRTTTRGAASGTAKSRSK